MGDDQASDSIPQYFSLLRHFSALHSVLLPSVICVRSHIVSSVQPKKFVGLLFPSGGGAQTVGVDEVALGVASGIAQAELVRALETAGGE